MKVNSFKIFALYLALLGFSSPTNAGEAHFCNNIGCVAGHGAEYVVKTSIVPSLAQHFALEQWWQPHNQTSFKTSDALTIAGATCLSVLFSWVKPQLPVALHTATHYGALGAMNWVLSRVTSHLSASIGHHAPLGTVGMVDLTQAPYLALSLLYAWQHYDQIDLMYHRVRTGEALKQWKENALTYSLSFQQPLVSIQQYLGLLPKSPQVKRKFDQAGAKAVLFCLPTGAKTAVPTSVEPSMLAQLHQLLIQSEFNLLVSRAFAQPLHWAVNQTQGMVAPFLSFILTSPHDHTTCDHDHHEGHDHDGHNEECPVPHPYR